MPWPPPALAWRSPSAGSTVAPPCRGLPPRRRPRPCHRAAHLRRPRERLRRSARGRHPCEAGATAHVGEVHSAPGSTCLFVRVRGPVDLAALTAELPALWRDYSLLRWRRAVRPASQAPPGARSERGIGADGCRPEQLSECILSRGTGHSATPHGPGRGRRSGRSQAPSADGQASRDRWSRSIPGPAC